MYLRKRSELARVHVKVACGFLTRSFETFPGCRSNGSCSSWPCYDDIVLKIKVDVVAISAATHTIRGRRCHQGCHGTVKLAAVGCISRCPGITNVATQAHLAWASFQNEGNVTQWRSHEKLKKLRSWWVVDFTCHAAHQHNQTQMICTACEGVAQCPRTHYINCLCQPLLKAIDSSFQCTPEHVRLNIESFCPSNFKPPTDSFQRAPEHIISI